MFVCLNVDDCQTEKKHIKIVSFGCLLKCYVWLVTKSNSLCQTTTDRQYNVKKHVCFCALIFDQCRGDYGPGHATITDLKCTGIKIWPQKGASRAVNNNK